MRLHRTAMVCGLSGKSTICRIADWVGKGEKTTKPNSSADGNREHTVQPKMVYLSQPAELGALYSLAELEAISDVCRKNQLFLYVDGARLGYGLAASDNDVTLADMARLCDVFYISGTESMRVVWRGGCDSESVFAGGFPLCYQAAGRYAGKREIVRDSVHDAF